MIGSFQATEEKPARMIVGISDSDIKVWREGGHACFELNELSKGLFPFDIVFQWELNGQHGLAFCPVHEAFFVVLGEAFEGIGDADSSNGLGFLVTAREAPLITLYLFRGPTDADNARTMRKRGCITNDTVQITQMSNGKHQKPELQ